MSSCIHPDTTNAAHSASSCLPRPKRGAERRLPVAPGPPDVPAPATPLLPLSLLPRASATTSTSSCRCPCAWPLPWLPVASRVAAWGPAGVCLVTQLPRSTGRYTTSRSVQLTTWFHLHSPSRTQGSGQQSQFLPAAAAACQERLMLSLTNSFQHISRRFLSHTPHMRVQVVPRPIIHLQLQHSKVLPARKCIVGSFQTHLLQPAPLPPSLPSALCDRSENSPSAPELTDAAHKEVFIW